MSSQKKIYYGWFIVAAGTVLAACAVGLMSNCFSLFIVPVCNELGFSRSQMSLNQTIFNGGMMAVSLLWAPVFSRFRLKRMMILASAVACGGYFLYSLARQAWMFWCISVVLSLCIGMLSWTPLTVMIGNWFNEKRGLAIGLAFMGSGLGGMVFNALGGVLISSFGWRSTYVIFALVLAALMLPTTLFVVKIKPEDMGLEPYGKAPVASDGVPQGLTIAQAMKRPDFYVLAVCMTALGLCMNCVNLTMTPHLQTLGYTAVFAAGVSATYMAFLAAGKIALGALSDRIGNFRSSLLAMACLLTSAVGMYLAGHIVTIPIIVVCAGMGTAFGSVAYPLIARDLYGERDQAAISGIFNSCGSLGGTIGPTACGLVCDLTGSYSPAYLAMAAMVIVFGGIMLVTIRRRGGKV